jgi:hypothetical protein
MARRRSIARDPAPTEIENRCAEIRRGWSEMTHRVRAGYGRNYEAVAQNEAWLPPVVNSLDLDLDPAWDW